MITDEVKISVYAGKGGNGSVAFNKTKMSLGPTGGKGGNGGNVYFQGVSDLTALKYYKNKKDHHAGDGENGRADKSTGHNGKDLILNVPIGSVLRNIADGEEVEITKNKERVLVAEGGMGGRGNFYFRSPINTSPKESEDGKSGEKSDFEIELRLIADIGLIGLPNAGKSSLLNELTKANVKVANYSFTTLEPNLGTLDDMIIADIPGLIEGASMGRGLGIKFLRHIRRTRALVHCISADSSGIIRDYNIIRKELKNFSKDLIEKKEMVLLTKSDLVEEKDLMRKMKKFIDKKIEVLAVSIHDWEKLEKLKKKLRNI